MTLAQAMKLGQAAKAIGSSIEVSKGMYRMANVAYNAKGKATVTPLSGFFHSPVGFDPR